MWHKALTHWHINVKAAFAGRNQKRNSGKIHQFIGCSEHTTFDHMTRRFHEGLAFAYLCAIQPQHPSNESWSMNRRCQHAESASCTNVTLIHWLGPAPTSSTQPKRTTGGLTRPTQPQLWAFVTGHTREPTCSVSTFRCSGCSKHPSCRRSPVASCNWPVI